MKSLSRIAVVLVLGASVAYAQSRITVLKICDADGSQCVEVDTGDALTATRSCTLENDSTPFDGCVTTSGLPSATEDATVVGNGSSFEAKVLPSCSNATTSKLLYNSSTNAFSCGTDQDTGGGGGAPTDATYVTTTANGTLTNEVVVGVADDTIFVGNGTTIQAKTLTTCTGTGKAITYDAATNSFGCNTISGGGGSVFHAWTANQAVLPAAAFPSRWTRNAHPILQFDATSDECAYFGGVLSPSYGGNGLTFTIGWLAKSATSNAVGWLLAIERHEDDADALDADWFGSDNSVSATAPNVAGEMDYATITFTNGADMDSLAAGESFRARLCRDGDGSVVTDNMTDDAQLMRLSYRETP